MVNYMGVPQGYVLGPFLLSFNMNTAVFANFEVMVGVLKL